MKKITSIALMLVMMLALAVPALAADETKINITVPGEETNNETYTVYKIFDATVNGEVKDQTGTEPDGTVSTFANVAYTIKTDSPFYDVIETYAEEGKTVFELKNDPAHPNQKTVVLAEGVTTYSAAGLATALKAVEDKADAAVLTNEKAPLTIPAPGYYMILSSLGSNAVIDTVGKESMSITTKNDLPTLTKKITAVTNGAKTGDDAGAVEGADSASVSYGSTVTYTITVDIPESTVGAITVHDEMDIEKLTYGSMTAVEGITETVFETPKADGCTQEYVISADYVSKHLGGTAVITYTATVKDGVDTATAMQNSAHLTYSAYTSTPDIVEVKTYEFDLVKTNGDSVLLPGATFQLFNASEGGTAYKFLYDEATKTYTLCNDATNEAATADIAVTGGQVTVKGLGAGTYYLEETVTPDGYNPLDARRAVVMADGNKKANVIDGKAETGKGEIVVNLTGAELPSTGGIGTTIFYVVGGLLVIGAGVMLVTKKRVSDQEQ